MITKTISNLPPEIACYFDKMLLRSPIPGMKEAKHYRNIYESQALKKYGKNSRKMKDFNETLEIYEIIYEWKTAQEAYDNSKEKESFKRPVVPTEKIYRLRGWLGKELRYSFWNSEFTKTIPKKWKNHAIS